MGEREQRARRLPGRVVDIPADEWAALPVTQPRVAVAAPSARPSQRWSRQALTRQAPFALVFLLAIFLLTLNIATPWHSSHEDNGLVFESAAINHIRFGLGFTKGQDYFDLSVTQPAISPASIHPQGVSDAQEFQYFLTGTTHPELYGHHPALLGLTIAGSLLVFGYHFWAVRLVPIAFTLGALLLFYRLMTLLFDRRSAAFASLLFITFPIAAYYGRNVAHEAPTMCCEMGMALCYLLWRRSGQRAWLLGIAGCVALGMAYGWPMLFFAWILLALDFLAVRRFDWRLALATGATATVVFALVVAQIDWAGGGSLDSLRDAFFTRSSSPVATQPLEWLKALLTHNVEDFGPWTWLALPAALFALWRRYRREGLSPRVRVVALFGLGGLAHILAFREGAYIHDYWQFYLIPFYAAALGWMGVELAHWLAAHPLLARVRAPGDAQTALLVVFACAALLMAAPLIYHLYSGGSLLHFPGTEPVTPFGALSSPLAQAVALLP
ncbi:MAG TPA: glycosyltransferase family 39 protein [Ktedonobacterales bacterium]